MKSETVRLPNYFRGLEEVEKQLDPVNVRLLSAMWRVGPRNLLKISRRTRVSPTSVHERVARLEAKSGRIAFLVTQTAKVGLSRVVVLVESTAGSEEVVTAALKIPNLWRSIIRCEGVFTHLSVHGVPYAFMNDFRECVKRLSKLGLIRRYRIFQTENYLPNFPDFSYYDAKQRSWRFEWQEWMEALKRETPRHLASRPKHQPVHVDRKDLLIIKELEENARVTLAHLATKLGMTVPGVKYRFDRLAEKGLVQPIAYEVYPYPVEISANHKVMLEFTTTHAMNAFLSLTPKLFFILGFGKVPNSKTVVMRTYIVESQLRKMFRFFSRMAQGGMIGSYSSLRLQFAGRERRTIPVELFDDEKGWVVDKHQCLRKLSKLISATNSHPVPSAARGHSKPAASSS